MPFTNPLRARGARGDSLHGVWSWSRDPLVLETLAACGAHYVCIDLQHGPAELGDVATLAAVVQGQGAAPIVRVPGHNPAVIGKVLDAGAFGVVVPLVDTAEQAAAAVAACRYPPHGHRSYGPFRAATAYGSLDPGVLGDAFVAVMIETRSGLEQVEQIVGTPGLDAIYVGPADLSLALGLPVAFEHEMGEHAEALVRIREACARYGVTAGIHCADGAMAARRLEQGFAMVTVATDLALVAQGARAELELLSHLRR
ncbi:MAG: hypothetical protein H0U62_05770 [Actinobacteria bacterium]|nr:hypothetical protein [Actinomycetota bacterium]